jgi:hypothetical protein
MDQIPAWTGPPFLPDPALLFQRFRDGDQKILRMLFFHFFPPLCLFANRLIRDEEAAKQVAEKSLEKLWAERSGMKDWEAVKIFLYLNTYQDCSQFIETTENNSHSLKTTGNRSDMTEEEILASIVHAEIMSRIEEMPGAPEWLSHRLTPQFDGHIPPAHPLTGHEPEDPERGPSPI